MFIDALVSVRSTKRAGKGFTLIELLVVVAIIAILASILFPVFSRARAQARKSTCQSNLQQIGLALIQYNQDNDSNYPGFWSRNYDLQTDYGMGYFVQPYLKSQQVLYCPEDSVHDGSSSLSWANGDYTDYSYNLFLGQEYPGSLPSNDYPSGWECATAGPFAGAYCGYGGIAETQVSNAALTVEVCDGAPNESNNATWNAVWGDTFDANSSYPTWSYTDYNASPVQYVPRSPATWHGGGANYLMCDGHVKWYQPQVVGSGWYSRYTAGYDASGWPTYVGYYATANSNYTTGPAVSSSKLGNYQVTFSPD